jgi:hypothetical protein
MSPGASAGEPVAATCSVSVVRPAVRNILLVVLLLIPAAASAVSVDQIVALSKAGVSEAVILAVLDRDRTVLSIEPEQVVVLKREGLSDTLIMAMLRSGREQGEEAARADASLNAASILSTLAMSATPNPQVVIVGHGPDRPDTGYADGIDRSIRRGPIIPPYAPYGYGVSYRRGFGSRMYESRPYDVDPSSYRGDRLLCRAQVNTAHGQGPSYVTECPPVMQPSFRVR